jgi:crotonobetainyl-CoA:carnitine CoA-transferase CaiB-like acyl-CoA transferase
MNTERWVAIAVGSDAQWQALCAVIGRPELADDPRFADVVSRYRHQQEADAIIAEWTRTRDYHEVMRRLQSAGVPAGGALTMAELHQDPHVRARGVFRPVTHPEQGSVPHTRVAYKLSRFPSAGPRLPAPRFGQDNAAVLGDLAGVSAEELGALADAGVVADRPRAVGG